MEIALKIVAAVVGVYLSAILMGIATENVSSFLLQLTIFLAWVVAMIAFLWLFAKKTSEASE